MNATLSPYLTARETIAYLRLGSSNALYRLVKQHRLPYCRVGRLYRFDRGEIDAWAHGFTSALDQVRAGRRSAAAGRGL
jgi:excisionase family DNA binding protein